MNDQIKALWMAQYLGQKHKNKTLEMVSINGEYFFRGENGINSLCSVKEVYLLLRTVDMLTDEESETIRLFFKYSLYDGSGRSFAKSLLNGLDKQNQQEAITCFQYLLRIGIILPFTYLNEDNQPVTLTPAEIIALGWAKIKTT